MYCKIEKIPKENLEELLKEMVSKRNPNDRIDNITIWSIKNGEIIPSTIKKAKSNEFIFVRDLETNMYFTPDSGIMRMFEHLEDVTFIGNEPKQNSQNYNYSVHFEKQDGVLNLENDIEQFTNFRNSTLDIRLTSFNTQIKSYIEEFNLNLEPDYQRGHVWTTQQRIEFMEFLLKGGVIPTIYLNENDYSFECVDGLQRITTIMMFNDNKLPVFGKYYRKNINAYHLGRINIKVGINDLQTRKEVLKWYLDLNTGGVVHTNEEIERVKELWNLERSK